MVLVFGVSLVLMTRIVSHLRRRLSYGTLLDVLLVIGALEDTLHINAGQVYLVGRNFAHVDEVLDFRNGDLRSHGHHRIEIARGLAEHQVAPVVAFPRLDEGEVGVERPLHYIPAAVELACLFALRNGGAEPSRCVERRDAGPGSADAFGERPLRVQLQFHRARDHHLLEHLVLANIGANVLTYLSIADQQAQTEVVHTDVVGDGRQVFHAFVRQGRNQVLGNPAQAEAAEHDHGAVLYVADRLIRVGYDLIHDLPRPDQQRAIVLIRTSAGQTENVGACSGRLGGSCVPDYEANQRVQHAKQQ